MDSSTILGLYERQGAQATGPGGLGALQHGWQCARLARRAGASPSLQLAAWLHDVGHLLIEATAQESPFARAERPAGVARVAPALVRNQHALRGAAALLPLFGPAVSGPIALHIEAKRCLAALRPAYRRGLTAADHHKLALQGGAMPLSEARTFLQRPHAPAALRLRLWDDAARDPHVAPPSVGAALDTIARLMRLLEIGSRASPRPPALLARPSFLPPPSTRAGLPADGMRTAR